MIANRLSIALAAMVLVGSSIALTAPAEARWGGGWHGGWRGGGWHGGWHRGWGWGGAALGGLALGAFAANAWGPAWGPGYYGYGWGPSCWLERRRVITPRGFVVFRTVRICN